MIIKPCHLSKNLSWHRENKLNGYDHHREWFSSTITVDHAGQEEDEETHTPSEGEGDSVHNMVIKSDIRKEKVRLTKTVNKGVIISL